jgi:hypothetical protein
MLDQKKISRHANSCRIAEPESCAGIAVFNAAARESD